MRERVKRSLHVGLNYPGTSAELAGCVNDANDWSKLLVGLGYDTTVLLEPSGADILDAIRAGLDGLRWSDRFVFTYSGHGSFVPDSDGDEIDGFDEVICPADFEQHVITDDQLSVAFDTARLGVRRTFVSDSCHSGTVNRFAPERRVMQVISNPRFMPPSTFLPDRLTRQIIADENSRWFTTVDDVIVPRRTRVPAVLLSGCDDHEYSYDAWFGERANGALSRAAIDAYTPERPDTMKHWYRAIREQLPSVRYPQTPQLQLRWYHLAWTL